jgi:PAS domain S-box-containing protein
VSLRCTAFNSQQYIIAVVRDISARKEAEDALAAEKERLAVTLRSIGDGVITTDTAGRVMLLNAVAETLTGWRQHEAVGRPLPEIFHIINEKTGAICANPVDKVIATGASVELANHTALIARDGTGRSIADSGAPIMDKDGGIIGMVLVFRDVTEKQRTDQELLKIKKLESVGVLAAGIAHDFNNILAAILGNLDMARTLLEPGQEVTTLIEEAEAASLRARDLTQQLLTFARGGAPVRQAASIAGVIKDSTAFVLRGSEVDSVFDIPDDLWLVDIDAGQMSQVIQNIIINARQAMPEGGKVTITCRNIREYGSGNASDQGRFVAIAISNPGTPIPEHLLETIFDPYFTTKSDGSGLGLAVCHSIITKHDGRIEVSSVPGHETTFTILLPASQKATVAAKQVEKPASAPAPGRILIMDDEEMIRNISKKMLRRLGHEVDTVEGGRQAIKAYRQAMAAGRCYDLVIMDLTIPGGMGGKEAATELLALDPNASLLVSSGYSNDPVMADFAAYGFAGVIAKPFLMEDLSRTVNNQLSRKHLPA